MGEENKNKGQKNGEAADKNNDSGKKKNGSEPVILSVKMDCKRCAESVEKAVKKFGGVEGVNCDLKSNEVTVKGKVDPLKLRDWVQQEMKKKKKNVELISPLPKKNGDNKAGDEKKTKGQSKKEEKPGDKKNKPSPPTSNLDIDEQVARAIIYQYEVEDRHKAKAKAKAKASSSVSPFESAAPPLPSPSEYKNSIQELENKNKELENKNKELEKQIKRLQSDQTNEKKVTAAKYASFQEPKSSIALRLQDRRIGTPTKLKLELKRTQLLDLAKKETNEGEHQMALLCSFYETEFSLRLSLI